MPLRRLSRRGTLIVALASVSTALLIVLTLATGARADRTALSKPPNNLGLVGYWSFDDGAGTIATDFSGNGNHGTLVNSPEWILGKRGKALQFDGASDHVNVDTASWSASTGTFSFWVSPTRVQSGTVNYVLCHHSGSGSGCGIGNRIYARIEDGNLVIGLGATGNIITSQSAPLNTWTHFAFSYNNGAYEVFKNGLLTNAGSYGDSLTIQTAAAIGADNTAPTASAFGGLIDEVRIYNRALAPAEIERLYRAGAARIGVSTTELQRGSSLERGLVGHWTFDGPDTQSTITDRSGMGNHGYFIGGATSSAKTIGKLGQALKFDGVDDSVGQITIPNMTQYAVSAWVKRQAGAGGDPKSIVSGRTSPTGYFSLLAIRNNDNRFYSYRSSQDSAIYSDFVVPENEYVHLASVQTGSDHILYANGVEVARRSNHISYSALELVFGRGFSGRYYKGDVDDVRIYNRALSPDEIKQLYNLGQTTIKR